MRTNSPSPSALERSARLVEDEATLEERIDELERDLDECQDELDDLVADRRDLEETVSERREFSDEVHETFREIGLEARQSVLQVDAPAFDFQDWIGTGWVYDDVVVTASRVPELADELDLITYEGSRREVEAVRLPDGVPVAALEVSTEGIDPLPVGSADGLEADEELLCVSNPARVGGWLLSVGRYLGPVPDDDSAFRTDHPIPGAVSGSPVLDRDGRVVGVAMGDRQRDEPPTPESLSRSETLFERYPETRDLEVVHVDEFVTRFEEER